MAVPEDSSTTSLSASDHAASDWNDEPEDPGLPSELMRGLVSPRLLMGLGKPAIVLTPTGNISLLNKEAEALFGRTTDEVKGQPVGVLGQFLDADGSVLYRGLRLMWREGQWNHEDCVRLCSGKERRISITATLSYAPEGPVGIIALVTDLTSSREREARVAHRLRVERALTMASRMLVSPADVDFQELLGTIGEALKAASVYLVTIPTEDQPFRDDELADVTPRQLGMGLTVWSREGSDKESASDLQQALPQNLFELLDGQGDGGMAPDDPPSAFAVPVLSSEDELYGYLGIEHDVKAGQSDVLIPSEWEEEDVRVLQVLGDLLATYLERNHAMLALRESEERWRRLVESHPDPIVITQDLRIVYINSTGASVLGADDAQQVISRQYSLLDFVSAEMHEELSERLEAVTQGKTPASMQHELIRLDGQERIVESYAVPINYRGQAAVQTVLRDITERIKSEQRYRTFVETISEGIWYAELTRPVSERTKTSIQVAHIVQHAHIADFNAVMEGIAEAVGIADLEGRALRDILPDEAIVEDFVDAEYRLRNREFAVRLPDGTTKYFVLNVAGTVERGELVRIWGSVIDVTERVQLERRMLSALEQQQQRIGRDLHDGVGQLMTGVRMLSQNLASSGFDDDDPRKAQAEKIAEFAGDASQHVRDIYRGLTPVQLHQEGLIAALDELVHTTDGLPDVACSFDFDGECDISDREATLQLYRIAQEAINNALKHAEAAHIHLTLRNEGERILLQIRDNGIGFEVEAERNSSIGLDSMVYRAHTLQADLQIESTPGEGTIVRCLIPPSVAVAPSDEA